MTTRPPEEVASAASTSSADAEAAEDFSTSRRGRRHRWFGFKRHVKRILSWRLPHLAVRGLVRMRPELRQGGRLPAPAYIKEVDGVVQGARFTMLRPDRCIVAKELYWGGGRRPKPEDNLALELFAGFASEADVVLDVGAYTGIFTLASVAVNPRVEVHAFEIVPEVFRALFDNCVRNDILPRVALHHVGLGAPDTVVTIPAESRGSALPDFFSPRLHFRKGVRIAMRSLDSMLALIQPPRRVAMKVDVEGTENAVFEDGQRFLETHRPDILCEVLDGVGDASRLQELLTPHGYSFYLVRDSDLLGTPSIQPDARFRDWLFSLKTPSDLASRGLAVQS